MNIRGGKRLVGAHEVTESRVFLCEVRGPGGEQGRRGGIGGKGRRKGPALGLLPAVWRLQGRHLLSDVRCALGAF